MRYAISTNKTEIFQLILDKLDDKHFQKFHKELNELATALRRNEITSLLSTKQKELEKNNR